MPHKKMPNRALNLKHKPMPVISRNIPHQFSGSSSDFDIIGRLAFPKDLLYELATCDIAISQYHSISRCYLQCLSVAVLNVLHLHSGGTVEAFTSFSFKLYVPTE